MNTQIGYLWKKSSGSLIANGTLETAIGIEIKISVFKNTKKQKPNDADYHIVISKEIPETKEEKKMDDGGF
jgi:hypothetical protein